MYYLFAGGMKPLSAPPSDWQGVLAVLTPQELHDAALPAGLPAPAAPVDPHESQFCWLRVDHAGITGHLRTPPRANQSARRLSFSWAGGSLLVADHDHAAADCIARLTEQSAPLPDGPDSFLTALLLYLIRDDLPYIQQLESRLTVLEQAVLDNDTGRFLHRMSVLRKELTTALLCGVTLAAIAFVKLMTVDNLLSGGVTLTVALVVSLTLLCTVLAAKFIGATLPLLVHKVGLDPAVAASPMITTIVDAIALLVYFAIATALLGL